MIPFIDLQAQRRRLGTRVDDAILRVLAHGQFILGPEVRELEQLLAEFAGVGHAVTVGSGTDALVMPLMAKGVGPGDAVLVPSFTFAASAEAIVLAGASPVFVDVDEHDFNMTAASLEAGLKAAEAAGLRPKAVMPVDLFRQPARYPDLDKIARRHGLWVLADAAQSFGARLDNRRVGAWGDVSATSFYPSKPLGCYGDGGAIFTDDGDLVAVLKSIRVHGEGRDKYENVRIGLNGRMDTIQAAVLLQKLAIFEEEIEARDRIASRYNAQLADVVRVPRLNPGATSVWAQYTIQVDDREALIERLRAQGVPTAVFYPRPIHTQPPYLRYPRTPLPVTDWLAPRVLSLPMHAYLDEPTQEWVTAALRSALAP